MPHLRILIALAGLAGLLPAQEFRATLTGRVVDSSDSAVPAATVHARNKATNEVASAVAGGQGGYTIPFLRPGSYDITVEVAGFKKFIQEGLVLNLGQSATLDIRLEVGAVTEQVTVTAQAALLDTANADRGTVLDSKRLREIPMSARTAVMYAKLVPGVSFNGVLYAAYPAGQGSIQNWSINGSQNASNEFLLDGAPNNTRAGDNIIAYVPPIDAVQEFKIQSNSYDAQYGKTGGGVINMSLKSGTNRLHGNAYEFAQRTAWNANLFQNNAKAAPRDKSLFDQYGFQADGPVYIPGLYNGRDKTFFMGSFEGYRLQLPNPILTSVPEPEMLTGDFSKLADAQGRRISIFDPNTGRDQAGVWVRDAFPGNVIPGNRLSSVARNILGYLPKPNTVTPGQGYSSLNFFLSGGDNAGQNSVYSFTSKIDQNIGDKHRLFFRFGWNEFTYEDSSNGIRGRPGVNGDWGQKKINHAYVLDYVGSFTPTLIGNVRAAFNRFQWDVKMLPNSNFDITTLGLPKSLDAQLPVPGWFGLYSFSGYMPMGRYFYVNHTNNFSVQPNITKIQGAHALKAGVDLRWIQYAIQDPGGPLRLAGDGGWTQREYNRADALSGNAIASFLLGAPSSGGSDFNVFPFFTYRYYAPWVQDDWKVTRRLTVNLGLRWDINLSPYERFDRLNRGFDAAAVNPVDKLIDRARFPGFPTLKGGMLFAGTNGLGRTAVNIDKDNLQPRIGFAYAVNSKLVLRGGWGRTYLNPRNDYQQSNGFSQTTPVVTTLDGGRTPIRGLMDNLFPNGVQPPTGSALGLQTFLGRGFSFVNQDFQIPHVNQFSLGFQYALPRSSKVEVSYVGSRTKNLQTSKSFNDYSLAFRNSCDVMQGGNPLFCDQQLPNPFQNVQPFLGTGTYSSPTVSRAGLALPYPHFGGLTELTRNDGRIWYNSMQVTWETRSQRGLNILAAYTLAKQIEESGFLDVQQNIPQRSLVDFDRPHTLTVSAVYELPFGKGKRWAGGSHRVWSRLAGGWQMATVFNARSGTPWALPSGVLYLKEAKVQNIDWSASNVRAVRACIARWNDNGSITMQAFSTQLGCTDYDFLITPRYTPRFTPLRTGQVRLHTAPQVDISVTKVTRITEAMSLRFSAEAFNATNTYMFYATQFNNNANSALFGTLNKDSVGRGNANVPRLVQIGIKLIW